MNPTCLPWTHYVLLIARVLEDNVDAHEGAGNTFRKLISQLNSTEAAPATFPLAKESNTEKKSIVLSRGRNHVESGRIADVPSSCLQARCTICALAFLPQWGP